MKVGIDARLLSHTLTGIGRYTSEMCQALSGFANISLYLYSPSPIRADLSMGIKSAHERSKNWRNGLLRQVWAESYLPLWAKTDEIDVFWGPAHRLPRWLPQKISRVVTIHDLVWKYAGETMRPLSRILERIQMPQAVHSADRVVADSQATAKAVIREFSIESDRLEVVPLAAKKNDFIPPIEVLKQYGISLPYFLFVGTLEPRKNLVRLLMAFARLAEPLKERVMMVIAGGKGWGGVNINKVISDLDLESRVCLLGYVDETILAALYKNALFLAMPSLYEGFGLPLIEAMAYGTPALTSNNSSMPEVAGKAGLIIDPLDIDSIQHGLTQLISDSDLRTCLSLHAMENAANYDWTISANKMIGIFEQAIAERKVIHP